MPARKNIGRMALLLTAINLGLFFFRERFQYQPYASYASLYRACNGTCLRQWQQYAQDYPAAELAEARRIADSVTGKLQLTPLRVLAIGHFLYGRFSRQLGRPSPALLSASPLQQYKKLSASDTAQLWCGNFAEMFAYFCWSQGIACRNIEIMNPGDRHVLNESYLPETGQWVMTDLTHHLLLVGDSAQNLLNLQQARTAWRKNVYLKTWQLAGDSLQQKPVDPDTGFIRDYYGKENPAYYYHRTDGQKIYRTGNKIARYFLPVAWYDIFDNEAHGNVLFYVREVFALLWLFSLVAFAASRTKSSI